MQFANFLFLFLFVALFAVCSSEKPNGSEVTKTKPEVAPIVGGDSDEHGCKASAGYQWSIIKNECIRLFEIGIRLEPQAMALDKSVSAFIVFKSDTDEQQAEVFLPDHKQSVLFDLQKNVGVGDAGTWKHDDLILKQWKGMYILSDAKDSTLYQGHRN